MWCDGVYNEEDLAGDTYDAAMPMTNKPVTRIYCNFSPIGLPESLFLPKTARSGSRIMQINI